MQAYPIGTKGQPWGDEEKGLWLSKQEVKRSYQGEVVDKLQAVSDHFSRFQYGALSYNKTRYPLLAFTSAQMALNKPTVLITGGVHGYETSGVQGAIEFLLHHASDYHTHFNFVITPCISPWGYETINRWNPETIDPNRSFFQDSPAQEAQKVMDYVHSLDVPIFAHFDLHETTDTDDSEFRPALAAKIGSEFHDWGIPDGFYTVADSTRPQLDFQKAVINSVKKVTHIAPPDDKNQIIGSEMVQEGVIEYDKRALFLCAGFTDADYVTTTEVYPDSPKSTPEICIKAQIAAVIGGLDYLKSEIA
ncbi:M14 family metallopeptidase [Glaciecola sp. 1036]|uniref:M14 family metallopeptidase n=1 Tax=Alteromonadaceae TaxID=72275 RepID=UPI003D037EEA